MNSLVFLFLVFGCLGITTEIFFTAFYDNVQKIRAGESFDWSLSGNSYVWMFPIYGSAALLFSIAFPLVSDLPLLVRLLIYTLVIYIVEYITGWLLEKITGKCPWEYTTGWHLHGYIRLDYCLFWFIFGFGLESTYLFFSDLIA